MRRRPSWEEKSYICALARAIGLRVDTARIADREKACQVIRTLRLLNQRMNGVEAGSQEICTTRLLEAESLLSGLFCEV